MFHIHAKKAVPGCGKFHLAPARRQGIAHALASHAAGKARPPRSRGQDCPHQRQRKEPPLLRRGHPSPPHENAPSVADGRSPTLMRCPALNSGPLNCPGSMRPGRAPGSAPRPPLRAPRARLWRPRAARRPLFRAGPPHMGLRPDSPGTRGRPRRIGLAAHRTADNTRHMLVPDEAALHHNRLNLADGVASLFYFGLKTGNILIFFGFFL